MGIDGMGFRVFRIANPEEREMRDVGQEEALDSKCSMRGTSPPTADRPAYGRQARHANGITD